MVYPNSRAQELAALLEAHGQEFSSAWAELIHRNASFRPSDKWLETLLTSTQHGLDALVSELKTGSSSFMNAYLFNLSWACLRSGFESGEVAASLLLFKEAVRPLLRRLPEDGPVSAWALAEELDARLRQMAARFTSLYAAAESERLRLQQRQIDLLLRGAAQAGAALSLEEGLRLVSEGVIAAVDVDHYLLFLPGDQGRVQLRLGPGSRPLPEPAGSRFLLEDPFDPDQDPFLHSLLELREPLAVPGLPNRPEWMDSFLARLGLRSILALPLRAQDQLLAAVLAGTCREARAFTETQIGLAWGLAGTAALAVQSSRQMAEIQSQQRVTSVLLQEPEIEKVMEVICQEARNLTGAEDSSIFFLEDPGWLRLIFNLGGQPCHERIPVQGSLGGSALSQDRPLIANDPAAEREIYRPDHVPDNMMVVPLRTRGAAVGVLYLANKPGGFTQDDARILSSISHQGATAIENARLQEQLRGLAAVEERERLAREIHDNLAQSLSLLKLQASHIGDLLRQGETGQAASLLPELIQTVSEAHADAREAIFNLRSNPLAEAGFLDTVQAQLARLRQATGISARLEAPPKLPFSLPSHVAIQATRIIQEALTNVRKHACASVVVVWLEPLEACLRITVEDNGRGFDPARLQETDSGVGLNVMRERAEAAGGWIEIDSQPGQGTRLTACVPISERKITA